MHSAAVSVRIHNEPPTAVEFDSKARVFQRRGGCLLKVVKEVAKLLLSLLLLLDREIIGPLVR